MSERAPTPRQAAILELMQCSATRKLWMAGEVVRWASQGAHSPDLPKDAETAYHSLNSMTLRGWLEKLRDGGSVRYRLTDKAPT